PLIARGAGTGMAGESLGEGVGIDLNPHLRDMGEIGADTVGVQPGVVLQRLNAELAKVGRRFAPDPASAATCTIGGMLATNASGSRCLKHGYTRAHVSRLKVVLNNGDAADVGLETMATTAEAPSR